LNLSEPGGKPQPEAQQLDLFSMFGAAEVLPPTVSCKVNNWRKGSHGTTHNFETFQDGSNTMKFDYVIRNAAYHEMYNGHSSGANSVYYKFLDATYRVADCVYMIHPTSFLINAGSTPNA
jgi:Eco57I restriction endonuclease.